MSHQSAPPLRAKPTVGSAPRAEAPRLANGREAATDPGPARREWPRFAGADSDDEIRRLVAPQDTSHDALRQEEDDDGDKLEVVGLDYLVKSGRKGNGRVCDFCRLDLSVMITGVFQASCKM